MAKENKSNDALKIGVAMGALAAAAAAGLYVYGKNPAMAKKMKAWTLKAKAEVLEKIEKMQDVSEVAYNAAIDGVTSKYAKLKDVGEDQATALNSELKKYFKAIHRELSGPTKKAVKKVVKKVVAKTAASKS